MKLLRTVRKCPATPRRVRMRFECPRTWEGLAPTDDPGVRRCEACRQDVYFCATDEETREHARAGHCIAREEPDASLYSSRLVLGRPERPEPTEEEELAWQMILRERAIAEVLSTDPSSTGRACPSCGYSVPAWRETCRVCGLAVGRVRRGPPAG